MPLTNKTLPLFITAIMTTLVLSGCAGKPPTTLLADGQRFIDCPDSPNCVSSDSSSEQHAFAPMILTSSPEKSWPLIAKTLAALPGTTIVEKSESYLRAESRSSLMGFVDDVQLRLDGDRVSVYSASRLGYSDFGVNRKRLENLRQRLIEEGLVRPGN